MDTDGFCPFNVNLLLIITQPPKNNPPEIIGVYRCSSVFAFCNFIPLIANKQIDFLSNTDAHRWTQMDFALLM
ncbi:hypothetical protein FIS3754_12320 [Fischerella sp. NIES-3754]|nr:hypothetical protein FIS3754_12320 [Fischerella sp. NIES-3754]